MKKMPNWTREEGLILLESYIENRHQAFSKSSTVVKEVSTRLREMNPQMAKRHSSFRNVNGIHMMFMQLKGLDEEHPGKGLSRRSQLFEELWEEFLNSSKTA